MKSQQTAIMLYMTAFLSFSPFSVKEGHWQVGIRIKYLIPVNGFVGRERREKGKKSREMRWGVEHWLRAVSCGVSELSRRLERGRPAPSPA